MKKMIFVVSCVAIAIAGVLGVSEFNSEELTNNDLLIENVEALASGEGFTGIFNGQDWDTEKHFYNKIGEDWCPVKFSCTYVDGTYNAGISVNVGAPGGTPSISGSLSYTSGASQYPGHYINCHSGSGNCFNGTNCVRD